MNRVPARLRQVVVVVFISRTDGPDVFVHYSEIDGYGFRSLEEIEHVEFEAAQGPKGRQATRVRAA